MSKTRRRRAPKVGDVLLVQIAENVPPGVEQQGARPAVVVATPGSTGPQRVGVLVIVPLTTATGQWIRSNPTLYPRLSAGQGGLNLDTTAMIDHVQAVDAARVSKFFGTLTLDEFAPIKNGLEQMFGFGREGFL